jgi:hypothetical protein
MSIVHTTEAIESLLRRGLTPITDNRDALLELGFERAYPQVARGYEAALWERSIEFGRSSPNGYRVRACERAILDRSSKALKRISAAHSDLTAPTSLSIDDFASPKSIEVFGSS